MITLKPGRPAPAPTPHKPGDSYGSGRVVHVDGNGNPIVLFPGRDSPFELRTMPKRGKST